MKKTEADIGAPGNNTDKPPKDRSGCLWDILGFILEFIGGFFE